MRVFKRQQWIAFFLFYVCGIILWSRKEVIADESSETPDSSTKEESCTATTAGSDGQCVNPDASASGGSGGDVPPNVNTDALAGDKSNIDGDVPSNDSKPRRVVTKEELAKHNGKDGADIWLSVLGEVYDVSKGQQYYGPGMGYGAFAGTDCSVCFVSGKFTAEEAEKPLEDIETNNLGGILDWKKFYETHETYTYVGRLIDPRFFDERGSPTPSMQEFAKRVIVYQVEAAEKKKQRDIARKKRLAEREAKKKQEETAKKKAGTQPSKSKQERKVPDIL
jgi:predicted heme/steroid binding protein